MFGLVVTGETPGGIKYPGTEDEGEHIIRNRLGPGRVGTRKSIRKLLAITGTSRRHGVKDDGARW